MKTKKLERRRMRKKKSLKGREFLLRRKQGLKRCFSLAAYLTLLHLVLSFGCTECERVKGLTNFYRVYSVLDFLT